MFAQLLQPQLGAAGEAYPYHGSQVDNMRNVSFGRGQADVRSYLRCFLLLGIYPTGCGGLL